MLRPATTTHSGMHNQFNLMHTFLDPVNQSMESQGKGIHIVMDAKTAIELGAPICGI